MNLSAFDSELPEHAVNPRDQDGLLVSDLWHGARGQERWSQLPYTTRQKLSEGFQAKLDAIAAKAAKSTQQHTRAPNFTTQYAIDWGRAQGWKLIDRERYDYRTKRHHDLALGSDCSFDSPDGIVLIQGAGKNERPTHRQRFEDRGGIDFCQRLHYRFVYLEFIRGEKTPKTIEWWHGSP